MSDFFGVHVSELEYECRIQVSVFIQDLGRRMSRINEALAAKHSRQLHENPHQRMRIIKLGFRKPGLEI